MPRVLYSNPHVTLTLDEAYGIVRYVRSREPYASIEAARVMHEQLTVAVPALPNTPLRLLIDVRDAPARNDDAFEATITSSLRSFLPRFAAHAVLVKSAVGRLQAQRLASPRPTHGPTVFDDEAKALAHLGVRA